MSPDHKQYLVRKLRELANEGTLDEPRVDVADGAEGLPAAYERIGKQHDVLHEVAQGFGRQRTWTSKFSGRYLDQQAHNLIARVLGGDEPASALSEVVEHLDHYDEEQTVYVPLTGIETDRPFELGRVRLVRVEGALQKQVMERGHERLNATRNSNDEKAAFKRRFTESIEKHFSGRVCSEYRVVAEPGRAIERAEEETRLALDVLRLAMPMLYSESRKVFFGLAGEVKESTRWVLSLSGTHMRESGRRRERLFPFDLSEANRQHLEETGVLEFAELLQRPRHQLSGLETMLLEAMHWCGSAHSQTTTENRFLNLIIALESIFAKRGGRAISAHIAESVALVLETDYEPRVGLREQVQVFHRKRSGIAHGGERHVSLDEFAQLRVIVTRTLLTLMSMRNEIASADDLADWLDHLRLS